MRAIQYFKSKFPMNPMRMWCWTSGAIMVNLGVNLAGLTPNWLFWCILMGCNATFIVNLIRYTQE